MTHVEQPLPTVNDRPSIQSLVIADIQQREQVGIERYGSALQPFNRRDAGRDLYEELLDGVMYARQLRIEAAALDAAMFAVWDSGRWQWVTSLMTGDERDSAASAVNRHIQRLADTNAVVAGHFQDRAATTLRWWL